MADIYNIEAQEPRFHERHSQTISNAPTLPTAQALESARASLPDCESASYLTGQSAEATARHIVRDIVPALNGQAKSSRYFGFVTGGVLPIAEWADNVVSNADQNVMVHLPSQTVATEVENAALAMVADLLQLDAQQWKGRTFTTGATACNVLGLACGREATLAKKLGDSGTLGELGILGACLATGTREIQVLSSAAHSSLGKAASIVGLGRQSVKDLAVSKEQPWKMDLAALEEALRKPDTASIIAISLGDVNFGGFALDGVDEWRKLRELADRYGAWIHVDGAFGIFARVLKDKPEYEALYQKTEGVELADSITMDGHKLLNVPYDCGIFFTRSASTLQSIFVNPAAAYLSGSAAGIPSPLNIGIENSRRFRALPAYAVLISEGRPGMAQMVANMVDLTRRVASFLHSSPHYDLLPPQHDNVNEATILGHVFMTLLFRAKDKALNDVLTDKINETRQMYVSGSGWDGGKAVRIAVSNWRVDVAKDFAVVAAILTAVAEGREFDMELLS